MVKVQPLNVKRYFQTNVIQVSMEDFNVSPMLVEDLQAITYENNFISIGYNSQGCFFYK